MLEKSSILTSNSLLIQPVDLGLKMNIYIFSFFLLTVQFSFFFARYMNKYHVPSVVNFESIGFLIDGVKVVPFNTFSSGESVKQIVEADASKIVLEEVCLFKAGERRNSSR